MEKKRYFTNALIMVQMAMIICMWCYILKLEDRIIKKFDEKTYISNEVNTEEVRLTAGLNITNIDRIEEAVNQMQKDKEQAKVEEVDIQIVSEPAPDTESKDVYIYDGPVLTKTKGVNYSTYGHKETWYNLPMRGIIRIAKEAGIEGDYWIRDDGVKMYGDYVIVAADLEIFPRGSIVETSLGPGIVLDTGDFIYSNHYQFDIAVDW